MVYNIEYNRRVKIINNKNESTHHLLLDLGLQHTQQVRYTFEINKDTLIIQKYK